MPLLTGEVSEGSHAHTHAHTHKQTQLQSWIEDRQNKKLKKMNRKSLFSSHAPVVSTPSALLTPLVSPSLWGPGGRTQPWSCQDTSRRWRIRFARQAAFASVSFCCSFYPFFLWVIRPSAFPPPAPLRSSTCLPPTISLSQACTSSGHGSLSRLQRGSAWRGDLSYFPSPLHDTQTQTHAYMHFLAMTKLQTCFWLLFPWCV